MEYSLSLSVRTLWICLFLAAVSVASAISTLSVEKSKSHVLQKDRLLLSVGSAESVPPQCIPSGIDAFPGDIFTQEQRQRGGVLLHIAAMFYVSATMGIVCNRYFIPSLDIISEYLKLPSDVAGATFMAIGTSAPELFSSITGSFITEGDIGVGTIVGSAVFNLVGVTGLVGLVIWNEVLDIEWYPIARDCTVYGFTVLALIGIISDNIVKWWESLILVAIFILYIFIIYFNQKLEKFCIQQVNRVKQKSSRNREATSLLSGKVFAPEILEHQKCEKIERDSYSVEFPAQEEKNVLPNEPLTAHIEEVMSSGEEAPPVTLCSPPSSSGCGLAWWVLMYPARLVLCLTVPASDGRLYPLTFLMSVLWIGLLSYIAVWMVTVIGYTFSIPDSISGITILAVGTSVPEVITSIIVARNGYGNMAISNLVGSNTFDISFCLGVPWVIKTLLSSSKYLLVFSSALTYTTSTLLVTLVMFVAVFLISRWKLNRTVGMVFLTIYLVFLVLACMYEMNVFGEINLPTCAS